MADARRILVMSFTRIGDATISTCVIDPLRRGFPTALLTFFVGQRAAPLIEPEVDALVVYDPERHSGPRGKLRLVRELRALRPDLVVDLRDAAYARLLGGRHVPLRDRSRRHAGHRYLDALRRVGVETDGARPRIRLSDTERASAREWLVEAGAHDAPAPTVAIHPGGDWVYKHWGGVRFAAVADALCTRQRARILVFGGPGEEHLSDEVCKAMRQPYMRVDRVSLRMLAALLEACDLFIGNDSGPLHVADAVGTPCIAIYEPTDDVRSGPFGSEHVVIRSDMHLGCNPCHPGRHPGSCGRGFCEPLRSIQPDVVIAAAEAALARQAPR